MCRRKFREGELFFRSDALLKERQQQPLRIRELMASSWEKQLIPTDFYARHVLDRGEEKCNFNAIHFYSLRGTSRLSAPVFAEISFSSAEGKLNKWREESTFAIQTTEH